MLLRCARSSALLLVTAVVAVSFLAPTPASAAAFFEDTTGTTYDGAVRALAEEGVVQGCAEGQFCPGYLLTRGHLATMVADAAGVPASETDHFVDDDGDFHEQNLNALAAAGYVSGCADGEACPNERITRAEVAAIVAEAFALPPTEQRFFSDTTGVHADAIARVAAAGISTGCGADLTSYCPEDPLPRWQAAVLIARAMDLVPRAEVMTLEQREAEQAAIEAERQRQAELLAAKEAEAERYAVWDRLAQCESGGNWQINTGNGYYGGLQFSLSSWRGVGGSGYPHQNSREEQIKRGELLLARQGWGAWPACSLKLGYR